MMKQINKYIYLVMTSVIAVALFFYWWKGYNYLLAYQEQWQMFLWDSDYLMERLAYPGGMAAYLGEMLTQLYYVMWVGSLTLTLLLLACQQLTWRLMKPLCEASMYPLSFIPMLLLVCYYGDENAKLSYLVSVDVAMLLVWAYSKISNRVVRIVSGALIIPLFYWLIGPSVYMLALYAVIRDWKTGLVHVAASVLCPLLCAQFMPYELWRLAFGISYYRQPIMVPVLTIVVWVVLVLLPFVVRYLSKMQMVKTNAKVTAAVTMALVVCAMPLVRLGVNEDNASVIEYDYLLRRQDWNAIISIANRQNPDAPATVSILNLALAETGQLGETGFNYFQNGTRGLIPPFNKDFTISQIIGEIYYHIGMTNAAQQYAFESQEGLVDYNHSAFLTRRLAETNIVNGQYEVARKYLLQLQKTTFYKAWADDAMTYLGNEDKINAHEQWGMMRRATYKKNFLFSDAEVDKMFGLVFLNDTDNAIAMQYVVFAPILERNPEKYTQYLNVVQKHKPYMPACCREIAGQYGNTWRYLMGSE